VSTYRYVFKYRCFFMLTVIGIIAGLVLTGIYSSLSHVEVAVQGGARVESPDEYKLQRVLTLSDPYLSGEDIAELQSRLLELGYYTGTIDGVFGPATAAAVIEAREMYDMAAVPVVDAGLWAILSADPDVVITKKKMPPPPGNVSILVEVNKLRLTVLSDGEPYKSFPIAIGKWTTPTPIGEYKIANKSYRKASSPFGTRWMGLNVPWGSYGIHGTNNPGSIGTAASAGCMRMYTPHAEIVYEWVEVGTPVTIVGRDIERELQRPLHRQLRSGAVGKDVQYVQYLMRRIGFDPGPLDGRFGGDMEETVSKMQRYYGLPVTGKIDRNEQYLLGFK